MKIPNKTFGEQKRYMKKKRTTIKLLGLSDSFGINNILESVGFHCVAVMFERYDKKI